jgi:Leucine-rich repeat (LRR) protein
LYCNGNQLTNLNVSANTALTYLYCNGNQLTNLNVSANTALTYLDCEFNQLTNLDVSTNTALTQLNCEFNQLTSLDVRNGNNSVLEVFLCSGNSNLTCINVDNSQYSLMNWTGFGFSFDPQHYFSNNCSGTGIEENSTNKELLKVTDILGRETKQTNQPLFYIYDDGTVEKRIVIE